MEALPHHGYLEFHRDSLEVVRRGVGLHRPGEMADAVRILQDWVKQQEHLLKKDIHPVYLETFIVMCKGSLERVKAALDRMCTARTLLPHYFDPYDVLAEFQLVKGRSYVFPLPQPTEDHWRVLVWKFVGQLSTREVEAIYKIIFTTLDYIKRYDYHSGATIIYDVSELDLKYMLTNLNLMELKNFYMTVLESYALRVKKIHVITASKIVYTFINFFKQFLKKKIVDRLMVHESWEVLQQYYPRHVLPKDYSGTERSLDELQDDFIAQLASEDYREYLQELSAARVDDTLRPTRPDEDCGTFRTLTID
ncbi:alpha-tocopherol transfer protein-like [Aricia agestis]|uniref:alpha-tocopherol transfer protein-like n=1 Tax=Aricia agestis TaxID=91739 RepID=UPI001C206415|nr:alpha-tocopherol transfer protein-like [Aricia agestis]